MAYTISVDRCLECKKPLAKKKWFQRFCAPIDGTRICANRYGSREFYRKHYAKNAVDPRPRPPRSPSKRK